MGRIRRLQQKQQTGTNRGLSKNWFVRDWTLVGVYFDETRLLKHFLIQCISGADTEHSPGHRSHLSMMENSISLPLVSRPRQRPQLSRGTSRCLGVSWWPGCPRWPRVGGARAADYKTSRLFSVWGRVSTLARLLTQLTPITYQPGHPSQTSDKTWTDMDRRTHTLSLLRQASLWCIRSGGVSMI